MVSEGLSFGVWFQVWDMGWGERVLNLLLL